MIAQALQTIPTEQTDFRVVPVETPPQAVDYPRIENAVREILLAVGENPARPGLVDTPARVARAYAELMSGLRTDPSEHLQRVFPAECGELVLLRDIAFSSLCEHHLLPFTGKAHVAYLPDGNQVVGLSKLARTVETFARRPQMQERLTAQVADAIQQHLNPQGVLVVVEGEHMCMKMRGVRNGGGMMVTTAARGIYKEDPAARREVLAMMRDAVAH